jgi:hypothetical protein
MNLIEHTKAGCVLNSAAVLALLPPFRDGENRGSIVPQSPHHERIATNAH